MIPKFYISAQSVKLYYSNGSIKSEGELSQGMKKHKWIFYYPSGDTSAILHYEADQLNGKAEYFYPGQKPMAVEMWVNGLPDGLSCYYFDNGTLEKKGFYREGFYEGKWFFNNRDGALVREGRYVNGIPDGEWLSYYDNGVLWQKGRYSEGAEDGLWTFYRQNGALEYEGRYENGQRVGQWYEVTTKGKRKPISLKDD